MDENSKSNREAEHCQALFFPSMGLPDAGRPHRPVGFLFSLKPKDNFYQPSVGTLLPKRKSKETSRQDSYARWPLVASTINTRNHHVVTSDTTEKDKNKCNIVGPRLSYRTAGTGNLQRPPPTIRHRKCRKTGDAHTSYL